MASFADQIEASRQSHLAVRALEAAVRQQVGAAFMDWANGLYDARSVRWRLEAIIREAYRSSAAMGQAHIAAEAGIPRWKPRWMGRTLRSFYLDGLVADVQRNLREFKASEQTQTDLTRAISRIGHSAGVAAARGHTDAMLRSAKELSEQYGFMVRKLWQANFVNHVPCELCADLHDTEVDLDEEFPADNRLKVYGDLKGPPRHPRCVCHLVILFVGLENFREEDGDPTGGQPEAQTMTTTEVQKLRPGFFTRIVRWLKKLARVLRRTSDG